MSVYVLASIVKDPFALTKFIEADGYKYCLHLLQQPAENFIDHWNSDVSAQDQQSFKQHSDKFTKITIESTIKYYKSIGKQLPLSLAQYTPTETLESPQKYEPAYSTPRQLNSVAHGRITTGMIFGLLYGLYSSSKLFSLRTIPDAVYNALIFGAISYRGTDLHPFKYNDRDSFIYDRPVDNSLMNKIKAFGVVLVPLILISRNYWFLL